MASKIYLNFYHGRVTNAYNDDDDDDVQDDDVHEASLSAYFSMMIKMSMWLVTDRLRICDESDRLA